MKRWIPTLLLPFVLLQAPVLAQTESPSTGNEQRPSSQVTTPLAATEEPKAEPTLLPLKGTEQIHLQLVNCRGWLGLDCAIARLLLPASATIDQRELQFDNATQSLVTVLNATTILQGDLTGYQLTNSAIAPIQPLQPLPAHQIVSLPLTLQRSIMPPDHYTGSLYLTLQGRREYLSLPINLSVRNGPLIPLLVLFFGVILGRLFKYMQERGEPKAKSLGEIYHLQTDIETKLSAESIDQEDKQLLLAMVSEVRTLVDRNQLDTIPAQVQAIRNRLDILIQLQSAESELNKKADANPDSFKKDVDEFTQQIRMIRRKIAEKKDDEAKSLQEKLQADLDQSTSTPRGSAQTVEPYQRSLQKAKTATSQINQPGAITTRPDDPCSALQKFFGTLSGVSDRVQTEATFWIVRPLLSLILLVGLSGVGMGSLYIENGATFGSKPFSDYLGLILWGLSADVASRSLSSLQGSKE